MDEDKELPCADKMAFDTIKEAKAAAAVAEHLHGIKLACYLCQYCSLWHLSSS